MRLQSATIRDAFRLLASTRVLIIAGGSSTERGSSLTTRDALLPVIERLAKSVEVVDPSEGSALLTAVRRNDFALNVIYGRGGEDGTMQGFLDTLGIPYFGPGVLPSAIGMNKEIFISLISSWGYAVPYGGLVDSTLERKLRSNDSHGSYVLKPIDEGDSLGIRILDDWEELQTAIGAIAESDRLRWRVEQFIDGPFGTVALFERGGEILVGDVVLFELPEGHRFYDPALKLHLVQENAVPAYPTGRLAALVKDDAKTLYQKLLCSGLVRFDFMVQGDCPVYLEINTIPGFYPGSNADLSFTKQYSFDELVALTITSHLQ